LTVAICPGTFDPVTMGHLDIIRRAAAVFDRVIVAILDNQGKTHCFSLSERLQMLEDSCADLPNVEVDHFDGLLVEYARRRGVRVVVRGLRAVSDFEFEFTMALMNRRLDPTVEIMFMMTSTEYSYISSSLIKEVARFGGDITGLVPEAVAGRVRAKCEGT
jgi:pantetheine-phosphate adenylyltransferase